MSGNINEFLAQIEKHGIAKTSHFDVQFQISKLFERSGGIPQMLMFRCESAELPGRQIATSDNKIYGPIYKVPYQTIYAETTMTFVDTATLDIRIFFEDWLNRIFDPDTNQLQYLDDIIGQATVTQYDLRGSRDADGSVPAELVPVLQFQLINIFPTNVNQLTTAWSDDSPHKLAVTFFYERYLITALEFPKEYTTVTSLQPVSQNPRQDGLGRITERDAEIEKELPGYKNKNQATQPVNPRHLLPVKNAELINETEEMTKNVQESRHDAGTKEFHGGTDEDETSEQLSDETIKSRSDAGIPFAGPQNPALREKVQELKQKTEQSRSNPAIAPDTDG